MRVATTAAGSPVLLAATAVVMTFVVAIEQMTSAIGVSAPRLGSSAGLAFVTAAAAAFGTRIGAVTTRPDDAVIPWTVAASLSTTLGALLRFVAFPTPLWTGVTFTSFAACGLTLAAAVATALRAIIVPALGLGAVRHFGRPFVLVGVVASIGVWLTAMAHISDVQRGVMMGLLLATLAASLKGPLAFLYGRPPASPRLKTFSVLGSAAIQLGAVAIGHRLTPLSEVAAYPDPIVFAEWKKHRHVVTATPMGLELFRDHQMIDSPLDGPRMAEGLARPALWAARVKTHVLMLTSGAGRLERAVLEDEAIERATLVTADPALTGLASSLPDLGPHTRAMLGDPRLRIVFDEPAAWVTETDDHFDVVLLDVGAPTDYQAGKAYSAGVFSAIARRLEKDGVLALVAGSALQTPHAHASIRAAVRAAGLRTTAYHVPLPTLGERTILLASPSAPPTVEARPAGSDYFTQGVFLAATTATADRTPPEERPSQLHDLVAVERFRAERGLAALLYE